MSWIHLPHRGVLKISGPERKKFLKGLVTNDLHKLTEKNPLYTAILTPQGRFLYDLFVSEKDKDLYLEGERARLSDLLKRLSCFKLRAQVNLMFEPDLQVLVSLGTDKPSADKPTDKPLDAPNNRPKENEADALISCVLSLPDPRFIHFSSSETPSWQRALVFTDDMPTSLGSFEDYNQARLALGFPEGSLDMVPEKAIPLECGLDDLGAIDWQKGCYMGQELTARTKHRGLVRKRILPFKTSFPLSDVMPLADSAESYALMQGGKKMGNILSFSGHRGLVRLRIDALKELEENKTNGALTLQGHPVEINVPFWVTLP